MREIKFRAWDEESKIMIYDCGITPDKIPYTIPEDAMGESEAFDYWEDCPLMQFTGLLDKNGKEIYDLDFISWDRGRIGIWKVIWRTGAFWAQANNGKDEMLLSSLPTSELEVIGNEFENSYTIDIEKEERESQTWGLNQELKNRR